MTAGTRITEGEKKNDNQKGLANELTGQLLRMLALASRRQDLRLTRITNQKWLSAFHKET